MKKKPGDVAKARKRHLHIQANRDALKQLREKMTETALLMIWDGAILRFRSVRVILPDNAKEQDQIVFFHRGGKGKLELGLYDSHMRVLTAGSRMVGYLPDKQILGQVVTEDLPGTETEVK